MPKHNRPMVHCRICGQPMRQNRLQKHEQMHLKRRGGLPVQIIDDTKQPSKPTPRPSGMLCPRCNQWVPTGEMKHHLSTCSKRRSQGSASNFNVSLSCYVILCRMQTHCARQGHDSEPVRAMFQLLRDDFTTTSHAIPGDYCPQCRCVYVYEDNFRTMCSFGHPLCYRLTLDEWQKPSPNPDDNWTDGLSGQSKLNMLGYNVNAANGLSPSQRHMLLGLALESRLYPSRYALRDFLTFLIDTAERRGDVTMEAAIQKWKADRTYVDQYRFGDARVVQILGVIG